MRIFLKRSKNDRKYLLRPQVPVVKVTSNRNLSGKYNFHATFPIPAVCRHLEQRLMNGHLSLMYTIRHIDKGLIGPLNPMFLFSSCCLPDQVLYAYRNCSTEDEAHGPSPFSCIQIPPF
jgi:hypothetical protein